MTDVHLEPKQAVAFLTEATEVLYGGAAGGGKSYLERTSGIRWCVEIPGIQVYLFRRTLPDLRDNHLRGPTSLHVMLDQYVQTGHCKYRAVENEFEFWNGAVLHLCYCDSENDVEKYRGAEIHVLIIDELTHFCVHPDTDVLTESGWKRIADVAVGDLVASLSEGGEIQYKAATKVLSFAHDGDLVCVDQKNGMRFKVTPNHRCVIEPQKGGQWRFCDADKLPAYPKLVYGGEWRGGMDVESFSFPAISGRGVGKNQNSAESISMDDWLEFMGWFLSEGSAFKSKTSSIVCIRQTKTAPTLDALFARLPWRTKITRKDGQYRIFSRQLYDALSSFGNCYQKRVPKYIFSLSARQQKIFFDAFVKGDGHIGRHGGITIGLANSALIDDLQQIATHLGYCTLRSSSLRKQYGKEFAAHILNVSARTRKSIEVTPSAITREAYSGAVHCLTVQDNGNFFARFDGRVFVTGNSDYQYRFLRSRVRIAGLAVPEKYKSRLPRIETASNPGSIGHAWVKRTFILPKPEMEIWRVGPEEGGMLRQFIPARLVDNPYLTRDDPQYADRLRGLGADNLVRAMLDGDWNIVAGQAFEKLRRDVHGIDPFEPPKDWQLFGSFDWGSSRPFSLCMWTVSDGNALPDGRTYPRGAMILYNEWYGWNGKPNEGTRMEVGEVGEGIADRYKDRKPSYIAADPAMWKVDGGPSHAETFLKHGVVLRKADNSRLTGYLAVRDRIAGDDEGPMLYACKNCHDGFWRTMPDIVMDDHHPEDVDCWVAGTMVSTPNGECPIEGMREGDMVDTPIGPQKVLAAYVSGPSETVLATLDDGRILQGTPRHKVYVTGHGLMRLDRLSCDLILTEKITWSRLLNTVVSCIADMRDAFTTMLGAEAKVCIGRFGGTPSVQFQMGTTFITSMGTMTTMPIPIWSACCVPITADNTTRNELRETLGFSIKNGGSPRRGKEFLETTQGRCSKERKNVNLRALIVGCLLLRDILIVIVANLARIFSVQRVARSKSAKSVESNSEPDRVKQKKFVPARIVAVGRCEEETLVYNLTVERSHLFYANGILSSNTSQEDHVYDSVRYGSMSRPWVRLADPKTKAKTKDYKSEDSDEEESWRTA